MVEAANLFIDVLGWIASVSAFREGFRVDPGGGGDIILGDRGHCGMASEDRLLWTSSVRGASKTPSMFGDCCVVFADNALCTAAAEGTDG